MYLPADCKDRLRAAFKEGVEMANFYADYDMLALRQLRFMRVGGLEERAVIRGWIYVKTTPRIVNKDT